MVLCFVNIFVIFFVKVFVIVFVICSVDLIVAVVGDHFGETFSGKLVSNPLSHRCSS